ncbi:MAG: hypothetical protein HUU16_00145 [Candidatus Omnitrophica bacterium]|nr:hypothetical protein [Candidatus Omnitrophota bacterium]
MNRRLKVLLFGFAAIGWALLVMGVTYVLDGIQAPGTGGVTITDKDANLITHFSDTNLVGVGTSSPSAHLHVQDTGLTNRGFLVEQVQSHAAAPLIRFQKAYGTPAAKAAVQNGNFAGAFVCQPYDGTAYLDTAAFGFSIDGAVSTGVVPTGFYIRTGTVNDSNGGTLRIVVTSGGAIQYPNNNQEVQWGSDVISVQGDTSNKVMIWEDGETQRASLSLGSSAGGAFSGNGRSSFGSTSYLGYWTQPAGTGYLYNPGSVSVDLPGLYLVPGVAGSDFDQPVPALFPTSAGTEIKALRVYAYLGNAASEFNFAVKKRAAGSMGTVTDLLAMNGTDYTQATATYDGVTGYYYVERNLTANPYTIVEGDAIWAVVRMNGNTSPGNAKIMTLKWSLGKVIY